MASAPSSVANRDTSRMEELGYVVATFDNSMKEHLVTVCTKKAKYSHDGNLFNGVSTTEDGYMEKDQPTGRLVSGEEDHLTDIQTKLLWSGAVRALESPEWCQQLTVHAGTTFFVKTTHGYEESQSPHVDSIPIYAPDVGSSNSAIARVAFRKGPFTLIIPHQGQPRTLAVVEGGHLKWRRKDSCKMSLLELQQAVDSIFCSDRSSKEQWVEIFALVAANFQYDGEFFMKDVVIPFGDFIILHHLLPHFGRGNYTLRTVCMTFFIAQLRNTRMVMLPETILVGDCIDDLLQVRCSSPCLTCKMNFMFMDFWVEDGCRYCATCYRRKNLCGGVLDRYAPSSEAQFREALQGALVLVAEMVHTREKHIVTVGQFGALLLAQEGVVPRFWCDLASWMCRASKARFSRTYGHGKPPVKPTKAGPLLDAINKFMDGMKAKHGLGLMHHCICSVMERTGQRPHPASA
jgi:hypothetical protein